MKTIATEYAEPIRMPGETVAEHYDRLLACDATYPWAPPVLEYDYLKGETQYRIRHATTRGERRAAVKLLLYIEHRAYREHGITV